MYLLIKPERPWGVEGDPGLLWGVDLLDGWSRELGTAHGTILVRFYAVDRLKARYRHHLPRPQSGHVIKTNDVEYSSE